MIKPHQIPDEVVKVAANAFYNATGPTSRDDWREAIAAAINAWPGWEGSWTGDGDTLRRTIILPLEGDK